jgi:hypothetical protein
MYDPGSRESFVAYLEEVLILKLLDKLWSITLILILILIIRLGTMKKQPDSYRFVSTTSTTCC